MLNVKDARRIFFRGQPDEKVALDGLNLTLAKSDFAIVIGSNGAGKSTLMNAISGALMLDSGRIEINGDDVTGMPVHRRAFHVARVFQDPMKGTAAGMTIAENMLLAEMRQSPARLRRGLTPARRDAYRENLSYLGLGLENRLDTPVSLLSGGQRQSLSLVMAVSGKPDILLLDTLGLLHGAQPDAFVVCHEAGREELIGFPGHKTGRIEQVIALTTELGRVVSPNIRCVGISLNTSRLDEAAAQAALSKLSDRHGLPACDPIRFGVAEIIDRMTDSN